MLRKWGKCGKQENMWKPYIYPKLKATFSHDSTGMLTPDRVYIAKCSQQCVQDYSAIEAVPNSKRIGSCVYVCKKTADIGLPLFLLFYSILLDFRRPSLIDNTGNFWNNSLYKISIWWISIKACFDEIEPCLV